MGALPEEEIKTVLVVEDDPSISDPLVRFLERNGLQTITARSVKETRAILERIVPDCVILDLGLADDPQGGFIVAAELKSHGAPPVMFYSASGAESDIELGFKLGADDFQVKGEISAKELLLRVNVLLRHSSGGGAAEILEPIDFGNLHIDPSAHTASLAGEPLLFSRKEHALLMRLVKDSGKVVTREALMTDVWDENWFGSTKTLDVHIGWLRRKLGDDPANPHFIHTVRGVGFRFATPEELDAG